MVSIVEFRIVESRFVEKFDGKNFSFWKFKLKMVLIDKGLWKYVNVGLVVNADEVQKEGDGRVLFTILLNFFDDVLV